MAHTVRRYRKETDMLNALIFAGIFLLALAFVAAAEKGCDWYWKRKEGRRWRS